MPLIQIIIILIVIGVALWAVNNFIPMDAKIKQLLNVVIVIAVVLWLLFFLLRMAGGGDAFRIGHALGRMVA